MYLYAMHLYAGYTGIVAVKPVSGRLREGNKDRSAPDKRFRCDLSCMVPLDPEAIHEINNITKAATVLQVTIKWPTTPTWLRCVLHYCTLPTFGSSLASVGP